MNRVDHFRFWLVYVSEVFEDNRLKSWLRNMQHCPLVLHVVGAHHVV